MSEEAAKILIVEDEQIVAVDIEGHLQRLGYCVVGTAVSGEEACRKAAELKPELVLMDIRIEGPIDGIETAERIRRCRDVPIIFLTASTDLETLKRAKRIQPYGYIVKPFAQRDLEGALEMALYKSAVDRQMRQSHENLQTILDAQRHGTVMLDAEGRVRFASRAVQRLAAASQTQLADCPLAQLLPFSADQAEALEAMCRRPPDERHNVPVVLGEDEPRPRHLEIEIIDDPRVHGGRILLVYDVSPLYDLRRQLDERCAFQDMVGKSKAMRQVFQIIEELARVDSTVLIEGETGTGKELVARAIHRLSRRGDRPFVALNCAGLSEELAASQLFGHRRGAFTGAVDDQRGLFEAANGGTLFLDEIGELPVRVQTALLRVLEESAVLPLGDSSLRPINVRTVAATHRDLAREAAADCFRKDLLYRIRVARVWLPPLRDRREDLSILVRAFLADHRASTGKHVEAVSDDAMAILMDYAWPGNVRELRNALEFAVIRARGSVIQPEELPPELLEFVPETACKPTSNEQGLDEADRVKAALKWARGNRTKAAQLLGISRATLYRRLRELEMEDN